MKDQNVMLFEQSEIILKAKPRGFHLVTDEITRQLPQISTVNKGLLHLLLQHSSASLSLNENADPTVRGDLEAHFNQFVPENDIYYQHTYEGADDMPAHIKSALIGVNLTLPLQYGRLALGTWQGIILGEHRDHAPTRHIFATLQGVITNS
jgi:secondary thiamine-phosphate synthase enzyme